MYSRSGANSSHQGRTGQTDWTGRHQSNSVSRQGLRTIYPSRKREIDSERFSNHVPPSSNEKVFDSRSSRQGVPFRNIVMSTPKSGAHYRQAFSPQMSPIKVYPDPNSADLVDVAFSAPRSSNAHFQSLPSYIPETGTPISRTYRSLPENVSESRGSQALKGRACKR